MTSGPQHAAIAKALLEMADEVSIRTAEGSHAISARAQVHATLALVAVTAGERWSERYGETSEFSYAQDPKEWAEVFKADEETS